MEGQSLDKLDVISIIAVP